MRIGQKGLPKLPWSLGVVCRLAETRSRVRALGKLVNVHITSPEGSILDMNLRLDRVTITTRLVQSIMKHFVFNSDA